MMNHKELIYQINGKELRFNKTHIMGIVNLTPDSFYDGGKLNSVSSVLLNIEQKIHEGASIIDIGAASSKPNAKALSADEEIERLKPILPLVKKEFSEVFISIDTYHSKVAEYALNEGVEIINDISAGEIDDEMIDVVAKFDAIYIMMHMQGTPQTMQLNPNYTDVVAEVYSFLSNKIDYCKTKKLNKIIIDLGFGFGKTLEHNYQLLKSLQQFTQLNYPLLAGLSRKSMISKVLNSSADKALNGTTVLNTIALLNGAQLLRVHDVSEAKETADLIAFYQKA